MIPAALSLAFTPRIHASSTANLRIPRRTFERRPRSFELNLVLPHPNSNLFLSPKCINRSLLYSPLPVPSTSFWIEPRLIHVSKALFYVSPRRPYRFFEQKHATATQKVIKEEYIYIRYGDVAQRRVVYTVDVPPPSQTDFRHWVVPCCHPALLPSRIGLPSGAR
ncbi:hypothetical protein BJ912DRAFT_418935 [Pholiota molesta]|nr:hypothetical protein BJ912DRAFT_418935 [Pholiota molesta]